MRSAYDMPTLNSSATDHVRTSMGHCRNRPAQLRELFNARALIKQLVIRDLIVRYAQTFAGFLWALGLPVLTVLSGLIVRFAIAQVSGRPLEQQDVLSLASRAVLWSFFAGAIGSATASVSNQASLISKIYFPRETLPLAAILGQLIDTAIAGVALTLLLAVSSLGLSMNALISVVMLLLLVVLAFGICLLTSCANLFFRDVKFIVQVLISFGPFVTPVILPPEMLGARVGGWMLLNPLTPFIQGFTLPLTIRSTLLDQVVMSTPSGPLTVWSPWMFGYAFGLTSATLWLGLRVFRKYSMRFAEAA